MDISPVRPDSDNRLDTDTPEIAGKGSPSPIPGARWRRLLREPLLQFLLIGMALFVGYRVLNPSAEAGARSNVIELTNDDLVQMSVTWLAQGRPAPTAEQMMSLV